MLKVASTSIALLLMAAHHTALAGEPPRCVDTDEPWTTLSRVEGDAVVDGETLHVRFASLYDWMNWVVEQQLDGKTIAWPPTLQAVDFASATSDAGVMVGLPLNLVELNAEGVITPTDASSNPAGGPWIVHTDDFIEGTYWPRYLVFSDLQSAANVAATYHGELYHWDTGLVKLNGLCQMMNTPSGMGPGHAFEVEPGEPADPPEPAALPGGEDDLD
jgi:hypothetical protein